MSWKVLSFWIFGILSTLCLTTECYEIIMGVEIHWSDQLHNLLDHALFIVVNWIGIKMARSE